MTVAEDVPRSPQALFRSSTLRAKLITKTCKASPDDARTVTDHGGERRHDRRMAGQRS